MLDKIMCHKDTYIPFPMGTKVALKDGAFIFEINSNYADLDFGNIDGRTYNKVYGQPAKGKIVGIAKSDMIRWPGAQDKGNLNCYFVTFDANTKLEMRDNNDNDETHNINSEQVFAVLVSDVTVQ